MPQSQPRPDPMYHWIPCMLRHDRKLLSREIAPTGEDYNAIFPAGVGLIWHQCEDAAELAAHVVNITANQGAIISVEPEGTGYQVIFANPQQLLPGHARPRTRPRRMDGALIMLTPLATNSAPAFGGGNRPSFAGRHHDGTGFLPSPQGHPRVLAALQLAGRAVGRCARRLGATSRPKPATCKPSLRPWRSPFKSWASATRRAFRPPSIRCLRST
jgi:hypothetical protein